MVEWEEQQKGGGVGTALAYEHLLADGIERDGLECALGPMARTPFVHWCAGRLTVLDVPFLQAALYLADSVRDAMLASLYSDFEDPAASMLSMACRPCDARTVAEIVLACGRAMEPGGPPDDGRCERGLGMLRLLADSPECVYRSTPLTMIAHVECSLGKLGPAKRHAREAYLLDGEQHLARILIRLIDSRT